MDQLSSFLFGFLQGVTEFLPISSSGHLFLLEKFLNIQQDSLSFIIVLHGATVLSVMTIFFKDLKSFAYSLNQKASQQLLLKIIVSSLPIAFVGFFLKPLVEKSFQEGLVSAGFLLTGLLLLLLIFKKRFSSSSHQLNQLSFLQAWILGLFQALAVLPGFSRSGWTVSMGLFLGLAPRSAVYYSFLISLPAILGSLLMEILSGSHSLSFTPQLLLAFLTAYISGTFALLLILKMAQHRTFFLFGFYLLPLSFYLILF